MLTCEPLESHWSLSTEKVPRKKMRRIQDLDAEQDAVFVEV
jgi:hypothetical protein